MCSIVLFNIVLTRLSLFPMQAIPISARLQVSFSPISAAETLNLLRIVSNRLRKIWRLSFKESLSGISSMTVRTPMCIVLAKIMDFRKSRFK